MSDTTRRGSSLREPHPGGTTGRASSEASMTDRDTDTRATSDRGATDPGNRSAAEIEREVEGTRARLTGTIEELRDRVSPGQVFEQGVDWLRGSGGNEFLGNLGRALRDNPMPVALIGAGIAWLALSGEKGDRRGSGHDDGRRVPPAHGAGLPDRMPAAPLQRGGSQGADRRAPDWAVPPYYADDDAAGLGRGAPPAGMAAHPAPGGGMGGGAMREAAGGLGASARDAAGRLSGAAHDAAEAAGRGWRGAADAAGEGWQGATGAASDLADQASQAGRAAARRASELGQEARHGIGRLLEEQPLLLGALGLAIGATLGAILPRSGTEDRLLGEARDELAGRATALADEAYAMARDRAGEAVEHASGRLDEAGLTPGKGAEALGKVARELREVVTGTARDVAGGSSQPPPDRPA